MLFILQGLIPILISLCQCSGEDTGTVFENSKLNIDNMKNKPIGFGLPQLPVEEIYEFPSAKDFIKNYVIPHKPVVIRNGAKISPAFEKWTDNYLLSVKIPKSEQVTVEKRKKEERDIGALSMHFHEFLRIYNTSDIFLVESTPKLLRQDLVVPCSIRCPKLKVVDTLMWFSSGGTKSVLHTDGYDNINCLYRGQKQLLLIDRNYSDYYHLDRPNGAYSTVDVDAVDYKKYPGLAKVEYYNVSTNAGDCLFIPELTAHQVRSFNSNLAINIWFQHESAKRISFETCDKDCTSKPLLSDVKVRGFVNPTLAVTFSEFQLELLVMLKNTKDGLSISKITKQFLAHPHIQPKIPNDEINTFVSVISDGIQCIDTDQDSNITESEATILSPECTDIITEMLENLSELVGEEFKNDPDQSESIYSKPKHNAACGQYSNDISGEF